MLVVAGGLKWGIDLTNVDLYPLLEIKTVHRFVKLVKKKALNKEYLQKHEARCTHACTVKL